MIRVFVADDDRDAQTKMVSLITADTSFQVLDRADNGEDALKKIKMGSFDVAFLDIEMPGLTGLEVASELSRTPNPPLVVFATAHDRYAIEAFEANAIDYVLKPYDPERVRKSLERVKQTLQSKPATQEKLQAPGGRDLMDRRSYRVALGRPAGRERGGCRGSWRWAL